MWYWIRYKFYIITLGLAFASLAVIVWTLVVAYWLLLRWVYFYASYHWIFVVLLIVVPAYLLGKWCEDNF